MTACTEFLTRAPLVVSVRGRGRSVTVFRELAGIITDFCSVSELEPEASIAQRGDRKAISVSRMFLLFVI